MGIFGTTLRDAFFGLYRGGNILFEREIWAYVAEIAVLKAGAAFLPFIPEYPDDRIGFCMEDGKAGLLLTTKAQTAGRNLEAGNYEILTLEDAFGAESLEEIRADACSTDMLKAAAPDDLAYCIYTSGSTGRPKGVMIEHRNIANYVHRNEKSIEIMHYAAPGRVRLALASFSFDVSVVEEFVPLCNGNTVVIATESEIHDPAAFSRLVKETGADGITCTPTYLMSLLEIPESREAIRQMTFFDIGAEAFPGQLYDRLRELREDSIILNVYGPTECTMGCAAALMHGGDHVTVGPPIANTVFYVADHFGNELPVGLKGELIICGDQVGRGYVNLPEKSAEAFFIHDGMRAYHSGDLASWTENGDIMDAYFGRELKPDFYFAMLAEEEEQEKNGRREKDREWFMGLYGDAKDNWCIIPKPDHESRNIDQAGRIKRLNFNAEQVEEAEKYWGVSHSVMAISAGLIALSRFTGEKHVMVNWIFNNRLAPEAENTAGMLIRSLPAALRMEEAAS